MLTTLALLASPALLLAAAAGDSDPAPAASLPDFYAQGWDERVGLWKRAGAGHTLGTHQLPEVHEGRSNASRLIAAGLDGLLGRIPVGRVLAALQTMQAVDGPRRGCFRWYLEDAEIRDTNAAFFIGLPLIVLRIRWGDQLGPDDRARLDAMLAGLAAWFEAEAAQHLVHYPNKHLGDLTCAWLLAEATRHVPPTLPDQMRSSAKYWREQEWGWGEHMSDIYSTVCLDELGMLRLLSKSLPPDIRREYEGLRDELLAIEDAFAGGPRVPAIRSYAFAATPKGGGYRAAVRAWDNKAISPNSHGPSLRSLAFELGWHASVPAPGTLASEIDVACFGGASARATIAGPLRLGAMSRYPIMEGIDHQTWGLSWQSFPVAAWHAQGGWMFLQWETNEGGERRSHPSESQSTSYLRNSLSSKIDPPPVGRTWSLKVGRSFVVLRRMPKWSPDWPEVIDRLRVVDLRSERRDQRHEGAWSQIRFQFAEGSMPENAIAVSFIDLTGTKRPVSAENTFKGIDWTVHHPRGEHEAGGSALGLWTFSLDDALAQPPTVAATPDGWRANWKSAEGDVVVVIRPDGDNPLTHG
ncbi:MAG: hypothetical protein NTW19_12640 [Planctomycetota bacterium]|nr:hypothetical protein [Planctomycetota bacterium]